MYNEWLHECVFSFCLLDTCSDCAEEAADCLSRAARLPLSFFFLLTPPPPSSSSLADPVGKSIEYATKTQTEEKLGDTWLNNHCGTLIFEGEKASGQYQRASAGGSEAGLQNAITGQDATWGGAEAMKTAPERETKGWGTRRGETKRH